MDSASVRTIRLSYPGPALKSEADGGTDTAVFNSKLNSGLAKNAKDAALPLGLPPPSLSALIHDLSAGNFQALEDIPGMTSPILQASERAYLEAFVQAVRGVWITAACFSAVAVVGTRSILSFSILGIIYCKTRLTRIDSIVFLARSNRGFQHAYGRPGRGRRRPIRREMKLGHWREVHCATDDPRAFAIIDRLVFQGSAAFGGLE